MKPVKLEVNGIVHEVFLEDRTSLADALRDDCGLTGTRLGCEHGVCGACTVLVNNRPERSCLVLATQAEGDTIGTIEGLAASPTVLAPVQQAFRQAHGLQCGFCTSGMLLTAQSLLDHDPDPSPAVIRDWMHGNLCRCTGFDQIIESVQLAATLIKQDQAREEELS
ncbi:(2Fe-2S)-binding protein [Arthrobacter psychrochitiniphilus]|uniref:Uncharacterized protein n=1 Tax=Arthrobacter psychrochitiniphilus TaxID=291045 RepID=A0A2V3DNR5_9MICC|nr:(2Fe-2S)-binding protein [Arthrobacter psychrochitiniphilus]NYG17913.1 carbon-monoxide dehydrogenase small subunit [Arthrobacter psychrochitiniphilus]PXA64119.1 hypothetical protein CVS29_16595 [Arthrobacter psychrochitiniphilus]